MKRNSHRDERFKYYSIYFFLPEIFGRSRSILQPLVEPYSCGQSGNRKPCCPWRCGPHTLSTRTFSYYQTCVNLEFFHIFFFFFNCTLQFCSQKDLGTNWTGKWVLMSRGEVLRFLAKSSPIKLKSGENNIYLPSVRSNKLNVCVLLFSCTWIRIGDGNFQEGHSFIDRDRRLSVWTCLTKIEQVKNVRNPCGS